MLRHSLYNLMGLGLPLLAAIVTIPLLIEALGADRFGILTLIWALVSYFGLFDLGLGRALTQKLSSRWASGLQEDTGQLVATSLVATAVLGGSVGVLLAWCAPWLVDQFDGVPNRRETIQAIYWMAVAMPFVIMTSALRGVLEAKGAFGILNVIRMPMGLYTFVAPLAVVHYWKNDLAAIALVLALGRAIAFLAHEFACRRLLVTSMRWLGASKPVLQELLRTGGWMTVSNVVSPLMGYLDRFLIGLTLSMAAVAYYVTPYELITKLWIIPAALTGVLFPRFAGTVPGNSAEPNNLFRHSVLLLYLVLFPITLAIALFANELLTLWLGESFASQSYRLLQVFSFGILVNSIAHVPFTFLQATGHARVVASIHLWELPFFVLILWYAAGEWGLLGAVLAWLTRMLVDTSLMFAYGNKLLGYRSLGWRDQGTPFVMLISISSFAAVLMDSHLGRLLAWGSAVALVSLCVWKVVLIPREGPSARKSSGYVAG